MHICTSPHLLLLLIANALLVTVQANVAGYLFLHFYNDKEQVYGSLSRGPMPLDQVMLKKGAPLLTSNVGTGGARDHFIVSRPDQSQHWILSTDLNLRKAGSYNNAFESRSIVVWSSKGPSLTQWNPPYLLNVAPPNCRQAWSPEAIWDAKSSSFILYWSSQEYADARHSGPPSANKIFIAHTRDFRSLTTPAHVYYARYQSSVIDMTIMPTGNAWDEYVRFFKDESTMKCMGQVSHNGLFGDWRDIAPGRYVGGNNRGEACQLVKWEARNKWFVLQDESEYYRNPPGYHAYYALNGILRDGYAEMWSSLPRGARHGSMKELNPAQYNEIKRAWGWGW